MEDIYNLFYFTDGDIITELGVVVHYSDASDEEKMRILQSLVSSDYLNCTKFNLSIINTEKLTIKYFDALSRLGKSADIFESIFKKYNASNNPLFCITPILNGKPKINMVTGTEPFTFDNYPDHPSAGLGKMNDYLVDYLIEDSFDIPSLINNDYFEAIKLLFNNENYVSCAKLIVSFIDTISFIEYGDVQDNFKNWLTIYSNIQNLNISESQLWEFRNSILHMSNINSRKVLAGKEKRISFCIAQSGYTPEEDGYVKYFNLKDLIDELAESLSRWISTYNEDRNKFAKFVERYDSILSDNRPAILKRNLSI